MKDSGNSKFRRLQQRTGIENYLIALCAQKAAFRKLLREDPARAITQELDLVLPEEISIDVIPEKDDEFVLVFPFDQEKENVSYEVRDIDLRHVNGGVQPEINLLDLLVNRLNGTLSGFMNER